MSPTENSKSYHDSNDSNDLMARLNINLQNQKSESRDHNLHGGQYQQFIHHNNEYEQRQDHIMLQHDSSIDSSKMNSPEILSSLPSLTALTTAISLPGQSDYLDLQQHLRNHPASAPVGKANVSSMLNISTTCSSSTSIPMDFKLHDDSGNYSAMNLIIVCVGLPARGKSYITKKLQKYLNWMQYETRIFNVGNTRRQEHTGPSDYPVPGPTNNSNNNNNNNNNNNTCNNNNNSSSSPQPLSNATSHDASFFDHNNPESFQKREQWAIETLNQVIDYVMSGEGNVGIFDATNTTKARRKWIIQTITNRTKGSVKIMFLESICTDQTLIEKNIRLKLSGPDYRDMDPNLALEDFRNRLHNYEKVYETIDEEEEKENEKYDIQYLKIINAGKKIVSYNINGYLASQAVFFLLNFNLSDRQIWLTVNGETDDSMNSIKGGDDKLNKKGEQFARALPKFIGKKRQEFKLRKLNQEYINDLFFDHQISNGNSSSAKLESEYNIWTSTLQRTIQTAAYFPQDEYQLKTFRMLNDLGCGLIDGLSDQEFRQNYPDDYSNLLKNKLSFRFPGLGGESYLDVISRVRPMIIELERLKEHVLIVSHRVITRVLLGYFMNLSKEMLTELDVQHGYVYCIEPKPYGLHLKIYNFDEYTDDFYEVDEIEFMKKKRHRGSLSISTNNKGKVVLNEKPSDNAVASSSEDDSSSSYVSEDSDSEEEEEDEEEEEEEDDDERYNTSMSNYTAQPFERTVSQSFEFRADSGTSTPIKVEYDFNGNNINESSPLKIRKNKNMNSSESSSNVNSINNSPLLNEFNLKFSRPNFLIDKTSTPTISRRSENAGHGKNVNNSKKKKKNHQKKNGKETGSFRNDDERRLFLESLKKLSLKRDNNNNNNDSDEEIRKKEQDIDDEVERILNNDELIAKIKKALGVS